MDARDLDDHNQLVAFRETDAEREQRHAKEAAEWSRTHAPNDPEPTPVTDVTVTLCFPLKVGEHWQGGRSVKGYESRVVGANAQTFHISRFEGAGVVLDLWFEKGVGILQQVIEHHGTYNEDRRQLLRATIEGKSRIFRLTPARTVPSGPFECGSGGWQHFGRVDGSTFTSQAACVSYFSRK